MAHATHNPISMEVEDWEDGRLENESKDIEDG